MVDIQEVVEGPTPDRDDGAFEVINNTGFGYDKDSLQLDIDQNLPIFRTEKIKRLPPEKPKIGAWESFWNSYKADANFNSLFRGANRLLETSNLPGENTFVPDGWTPANEDALLGIDIDFIPFVLNAKNPAEQEIKRQIALEATERRKVLAEGGPVSSFLGAMAGSLTGSPETIPLWFLLPQLAAGRYASLFKHTIKGLTTVTALGAVEGAAHEIIKQAADPGFNAEEVMLNTIMDAAFGALLYGAGRSIGYGVGKLDLYKTRKTTAATYDGINVKFQTDENNQIVGLVAEANDGSVSAARVKVVQDYLDSKPVVTGFSWILNQINKIPVVGSPLIKGLNSEWDEVRRFFNLMGNESIITEGIKRGAARQITADEILREYSNEARFVEFALEDLYKQSLDINPNNILAGIQAIKKQMSEGIESTREAFNKQIHHAIITGEDSAIRQVNDGAKLVSAHLDKVWKDYLEAFDLPTDILPPRTARGYMMRIYNRQAMTLNPDGFVRLVSKELGEQDNQISSLVAPIEKFKQIIKDLNAEMKIPYRKGGRKPSEINKDLAKYKRKLENYEKELVKKMRNGAIDPALLDERVLLTNAQFEDLKKIMAPLERLNAEIESLRADMKFNRPPAGQSTKAKLKVKPGASEAEIKAAIKEREKNQTARDKLDDLIQKRDEMIADLERRAMAGDIDSALFTVNKKGDVTFRSTKRVPQFRAVYADDEARKVAAMAYKDTIMNQTPEQVAQQIMGKMGAGSSAVNPAKARTLLISDKALFDGGFLSSEVGPMIGVYSRTLGRRIALKQTFENLELEDGLKSLTEELTVTRQLREDKITGGNLDQKKRDKELKKLQKSFNSAVEQITDAYNLFMGNHITYDRFYRTSKSARNLTAISMLRNVPLLQASEMGAIIFKQGPWNFITGGLIPLIKRMNLVKKDANYLENASHSRVGLEIELNKYINSLYENGAIENIPGNIVLSPVEKFIETSSKWSQRLFFTSQITNFQQRFSANVTQSRVMADLFRAKNGTITRSQRERLLVNGIDPKDYQLYIDAYKQAGGHKLHGGYVSNWYLWEDANLVQKMRRAINNDVRGSILEAGVFDKPFWASKNPAGAIVFQFLGYLYSATNKFAYPFAQGADASKVFGMLMMVGLGAMVEPMRKWQKNETVDIDSSRGLDQLFMDGIVESGFFGWPVDLIERLDALIDFLPERYQQDKFRRRPIAGQLAGPFGSYAQNVVDVFSMFAKGEINKDGLKKTLRVSPIALNLLLDKAVSASIDNSSLPENRAEAKRMK